MRNFSACLIPVITSIMYMYIHSLKYIFLVLYCFISPSGMSSSSICAAYIYRSVFLYGSVELYLYGGEDGGLC